MGWERVRTEKNMRRSERVPRIAPRTTKKGSWEMRNKTRRVTKVRYKGMDDIVNDASIIRDME